MSHVFEVVLEAIQKGILINNIFHIFDGNESETPDDIADVFENDFIPDIKTWQVDDYTWQAIKVTPMDVGNLQDPIIRLVDLAGGNTDDPLPHGNHLYVKLISDDNGFKSGGKLMGGFGEDDNAAGQVSTATLNGVQAVFDALLVDLVAAGLSLCIYRPTLSAPGFPQVSISSACLARGWGSNNRRQRDFQA